QPDGSLTRTLVPEAELAERWRGATPLPQLVEAAGAPGAALLDERVAATEQGEQNVISLSHDALARVVDARRRPDELRRQVRSKVIDILWACGAAVAVLALAAFFLVYRPQQHRIAESEARGAEITKLANEKLNELNEGKNELLNSLYPARVAQARAAWKQGDWLALQ